MAREDKHDKRKIDQGSSSDSTRDNTDRCASEAQSGDTKRETIDQTMLKKPHSVLHAASMAESASVTRSTEQAHSKTLPPPHSNTAARVEHHHHNNLSCSITDALPCNGDSRLNQQDRGHEELHASLPAVYKELPPSESTMGQQTCTSPPLATGTSTMIETSKAKTLLKPRVLLQKEPLPEDQGASGQDTPSETLQESGPVKPAKSALDVLPQQDETKIPALSGPVSATTAAAGSSSVIQDVPPQQDETKAPPSSSVAASAPGAASVSKADPVVPPAEPATAPLKIAASVAGSKRKKPSAAASKDASSGRWTPAEHQAFLRGLQTYGREWKKVAAHIPTRTSAQVRSHAQKYFAKLQREEVERDQQQQQHHHHEEAAPAAKHAVISSTTTPPVWSASVQAQAERILSEPETVQAEVQSTMELLRQRYRQLQQQMRQRQRQAALDQSANNVEQEEHEDDGGGGGGDEERTTTTCASSSIESLQNEELIALHVLHGGLASQQTRKRSLPSQQQQQAENGHDASGKLVFSVQQNVPAMATTTASKSETEPNGNDCNDDDGNMTMPNKRQKPDSE